MSNFIKVNNQGTEITLNVDYIVNVQKIASDLIYIEYCACDTDMRHPYIINRAEVRIKSRSEYDDIIDILFDKEY